MRNRRSDAFPYLNPTGGWRRTGWPLAFSHRGDASSDGENTLEAFRAAVERGYGYLELDVRTTRDGVVMVFHDDTVERVSDGTGRLEEHDFAELSRWRVAGRGIPRFEDVLAEWPDLRLNVDIKDEGSVVPFAELVNRYRAHDRVLVASFSDVRRRKVLSLLDAPAASSPGTVTVAAAVLLGKMGLLPLLRPWLHGVAALQVPERRGWLRIVTPRFVARAHRVGLHVHVWVVDDRRGMDRLLDLGVDGLITDRADLLAEAMDDRGFWPQRDPAPGGPAAGPGQTVSS